MTPVTTHAAIRLHQPADTAALDLLADALSPRSLWLRFHAGCSEPPKEWLRRLSRPDERRPALVAWADGRLVGVVELVTAAADPTTADLAVLVGDPWQWRGVGRRLVAAAAELADARGVRTLVADVLAENRTAVDGLGRWVGHEVTRAGAALTYRLPLSAGSAS